MKKQYIVWFLLAVLISLIINGMSNTVIGGKSFGPDFFRMLALNYPVCVLIGAVDVLIILFINRLMARFKEIYVLIVNVIVTTLVCCVILTLLNFLLSTIDIYTAMVKSIAVFAWSFLIVMMIELFIFSIRRERVEKEKALFQLMMLRRQLNPHFLFNSLNTLAALSYQDAQRTNLFAKKLSMVYRYLLDSLQAPAVSVDEEMAFVENYIILEKIRFEDNLEIDIRREIDTRGATILPSSIQLLVENAIKHNICTSTKHLVINIRIHDKGVTVSNPVQKRQPVRKSGHGLDNLARQYAIHNKNIEISDDRGLFTVTLPYITTPNKL